MAKRLLGAFIIFAGMAGAAEPDVMIERPSIKWLFGGFGFQNAEAQLTPLMTDEFRNERAVKCFRELAPSFARVYVGRADETKASLDRFADYYDQTFRPCDTTIYAVGGSLPGFPEKIDPKAHAEKVAANLEYLIRKRDCRKIRYYCLTNELMCDDQWAYFSKKDRMEDFKKFQEELYDAFRRHNLDIKLVASDGSYGLKQAEGLKWTVDNMALLTGLFCTHCYTGFQPDDSKAYGVFHDQFTNVVQLCLKKTKRWMLGEFGNLPPRKKGVMVDDQNWTYHNPSETGLWAITTAEMAMAAVNAGAYSVLSWSFCDYPDPFVVEDSHDSAGRARYESGKAVYQPDLKYNKNGLFRWCDVYRDYRPAPTYFTLGLMSRSFRKGAYILKTATSDSLLRATALENPDGSVTAAIVNRGAKRTVTLAGWGDTPRPARLYVYDSAKPYANPFCDLPAPTAEIQPKDGHLEFEIPDKGMVFLTTDYVKRVPPPVANLQVNARGEGLVAWTATGDRDHCYYRVFRDGEQVASTVATRIPYRGKGRYAVVAVDRWGNASEAVSDESFQSQIDAAAATAALARNVKIVCKGAGDLYVTNEVPEGKGTYPSSVIFGKGLPAWGLYMRHADNIRLENTVFTLAGADNRQRLVAEDADYVETLK